ncbi:MAG: iron ABC transporter permease, partial [Candidatus Rokubacteria bacterium]|nr:iron ABC transporter permease [Candidatus Rokubacteria bacterium]
MTDARGGSAPRVGAALGVALIWLFLVVFLVYPLTRIFYDAFTDDAGRFTVAHFVEFVGDAFYRRSLVNSLLLGLGTVAATSVLGFAIAVLLVRYEFAGRNLFSYLTLIPIISPPLVGVLGFTFIMGRAGTVNVLLMDWFDLLTPINFVYGVHGVLLVETFHLFPMITLNVVDALGKIDPALEEAAEGVGARGWRKFRTITLPLTTPGYVAGALLVFIWTVSDFATPLVLGVHDLLASQAYLNVVQFVDRRLFRMGIVISALMVLLAVGFLVAARRYVAIKDYSSLSYSRIARRRLSPLGQAGAVVFLSLVMLASFIPYLGVGLASVGRGWSLTPFPVHYTL